MYRLMIFIPASSSIVFEEIGELLKRKFASQNVAIEQTDKRIVILRDKCSLRIYWEDEPQVLIESQEIADHFAKDREDKEIIANCQRRLTTAGDPDPNMDCFNDYVFVIEVFESIPGLIVFDPEDGKFMEEM